MTKRGIIGVGTLLLGIGISGLVLLQAGIIFHPAVSPEKLPEVQSMEQNPAESPGQQVGQGEKKQLPNPEKLAAKPPEPTPAQGGNEAPPANQSGSVEKPIVPPRVGSGERVYSKQQSSAQSEPPQKQPPAKNSVAQGRNAVRGGTKYARKSESYARNEPAPRQGAGPANRAAASRKPVVIRVQLDAVQKREIKVARVHFGDRIVVKVRRFGQADREVYVSLGIPSAYRTRSQSGWSAGRPRAVLTPIRDNDEITLTEENTFGPGLTSMLDSKEGAVLKLGARSSGYPRMPLAGYDQGYYEVDMKIYPDNRWNVRPRSLL